MMMNDGMVPSCSSTYDSIVGICFNDELQESVLISQLQVILQANPNVVHEKDDLGCKLLHHASVHRSPEFCRELVSLSEDLVKTIDNEGCLPFHIACLSENIMTAKYLCRLYPESISITEGDGDTALRMVLFKRIGANKIELVKFLLDNDPGAVSTLDYEGQLPLHIATVCSNIDAIVKLVFDTYPEAIHTIDNRGHTPLYYARYFARRFNRTEIAITFLEQQMELEFHAHYDRTPDNNGQLPIHRALHNGDASVGGIKLMLAANQASIASADNQGHTPLHIACQAGNLDAAKYLMEIELNQDSLQATDTRGNLPLHLACRGGNCEVVSCILEQSTYGVSLQNSNKHTPIELLLFESECDRDSMDYVEAVRYLFQVNPVDTLKCLVKKADGITICDKRRVATKRKRV